MLQKRKMENSENNRRIIQHEESGSKYFIEKYLLKNKNNFIEKQMRALYECREIYKDDIDEVIRILSFALNNNDSVLLRHEIAYVLGQISNEKCNDILIRLLSDENENVMVRHEAAEGLAAVGSETNITIIRKFLNDKHVEIRETCELALCALIEKNKKIMCGCIQMDQEKDFEGENILVSEEKKEISKKEENKKVEKKENEESQEEICRRGGSKFKTIDPIVITSTKEKINIEELIANLFNENLSLKYRYEALFELRNLESPESLNAICEVLLKDRVSAIFRHEVAFVLGQLVHLDSLNYLVKSLENQKEHEMVRHEVALALGSLGSLNLQCEKYKIIQKKIISTLITYANDNCKVVAESCLVGLDYISENLNMQIEVF